MKTPLNIVILGLSITSSWGNGHASTFRGLVKGLAARGHRVLFLERDVPWYASNRDEPNSAGCSTHLYSSLEDLKQRFEHVIGAADLVILGSYVPEGIEVGRWLIGCAGVPIAFYDIDTPVTLAGLEQGSADYIDLDLIPKFHAYFSFTGGPTLRRLETQFGARMALPLYCVVDLETYQPQRAKRQWTLGYLGTYSEDRQPALQELLLHPATQAEEMRFVVAGPQYPEVIKWPANVDRTAHLAPAQHAAFYGAQDFTLNITRQVMKQAGYSPSVRLFEAGACSTAVISDWWLGLDSFFCIGEEILVAESTDDALRYLRDTTADVRNALGRRLRERVVREHSPAARAMQVESYLEQMIDHFPSNTSRRDGRNRQDSGRITAGLGLESGGLEAGAGAQRKVGECETERDLPQPVAENLRDGAGISQVFSVEAAG